MLSYICHSLQAPPQWQRAVHCKVANLHLHLPLQPFLHPQHTSSLYVCEASGSVVQHASQPPSGFLLHLQSFGDGISGFGIIAWLQQCPA